jgi:hypothetical protein
MDHDNPVREEPLVAAVDHGKSTMAARARGAVSARSPPPRPWLALICGVGEVRGGQREVGSPSTGKMEWRG